jgi:probable rRNA maturation factor
VLNQQSKVEWTPALEAILRRVADAVAAEFGLGPQVEVSIVVVDDQGIRELNARYRGIDAPTDVLSFSMREEGEAEPAFEEPADEQLLGDVIISLETAERQAREFGHGLEREVGFLAAHGLLHLLGCQHDDEAERSRMRDLEERVLAAAGLGR